MQDPGIPVGMSNNNNVYISCLDKYNKVIMLP